MTQHCLTHTTGGSRLVSRHPTFPPEEVHARDLTTRTPDSAGRRPPSPARAVKNNHLAPPASGRVPPAHPTERQRRRLARPPHRRMAHSTSRGVTTSTSSLKGPTNRPRSDDETYSMSRVLPSTRRITASLASHTVVKDRLRHSEPDEYRIAECHRRRHPRQLLSTLWQAPPP